MADSDYVMVDGQQVELTAAMSSLMVTEDHRMRSSGIWERLTESELGQVAAVPLETVRLISKFLARSAGLPGQKMEVVVRGLTASGSSAILWASRERVCQGRPETSSGLESHAPLFRSFDVSNYGVDQAVWHHSGYKDMRLRVEDEKDHDRDLVLVVAAVSLAMAPVKISVLLWDQEVVGTNEGTTDGHVQQAGYQVQDWVCLVRPMVEGDNLVLCEAGARQVIMTSSLFGGRSAEEADWSAVVSSVVLYMNYMVVLIRLAKVVVTSRGIGSPLREGLTALAVRCLEDGLITEVSSKAGSVGTHADARVRTLVSAFGKGVAVMSLEDAKSLGQLEEGLSVTTLMFLVCALRSFFSGVVTARYSGRNGDKSTMVGMDRADVGRSTKAYHEVFQRRSVPEDHFEQVKFRKNSEWASLVLQAFRLVVEKCMTVGAPGYSVRDNSAAIWAAVRWLAPMFCMEVRGAIHAFALGLAKRSPLYTGGHIAPGSVVDSVENGSAVDLEHDDPCGLWSIHAKGVEGHLLKDVHLFLRSRHAVVDSDFIEVRKADGQEMYDYKAVREATRDGVMVATIVEKSMVSYMLKWSGSNTTHNALPAGSVRQPADYGGVAAPFSEVDA